MSALETALAKYAAYHRDRRNVATHLVGIPMIFLAVVVLLSRPVFSWGGGTLTPAMLLSLAAAGFYFRLDLRFGLAMVQLLVLCCAVGLSLAEMETAKWLGWGLGLFVLGWIIQFVGHWYEGRKPAFVDDLTGLIVGPLFVAAEAAFLLGLRDEVRHAVEERAGPTCIREKKATA